MIPASLLEHAARVPRLIRVATLIGAAAMLGSCLYVMFGRLGYPYELEWMTGSILDHVERVRNGQPLYTPPTIDWIPFLYPPLFYWVAAKAMALLGPTFVACRAVSIAATFTSAACVWRLARRHGATRAWAWLAVGLFFSAYSQSDFWYDLPRPDSLFVAMLLVGTIVLRETRGVAGAALAAAVLASAFFAKQPAVLFIGAGGAALAWRREWLRALVYAVVAATIVGLGVHRLNQETGGWFSYYVLAMPAKHGISGTLVPLLLLVDLPHAATLLAATGLLVAGFVRRRGRDRDDVILVAMVAVSFAASASSRLHIGGWANVLTFWMTFAAVAAGVVGARLEAQWTERLAARPWMPWAVAGLYGAVGLQYAVQSYVPADHIPSRGSIARLDEVVRLVRDLEGRGEVLSLSHGHLTAHRHPHMAALLDVATVEGEIPAAVQDPIRQRRFAAIVLDGMPDLWLPTHPHFKGSFFRAVYANYYIARQLDDRLRPPITGWPSGFGWVMLPRSRPLPERPIEALRRRSLADITGASLREQAERAGASFPGEPYMSEETSDALYERIFGGAIETKDQDTIP